MEPGAGLEARGRKADPAAVGLDVAGGRGGGVDEEVGGTGGAGGGFGVEGDGRGRGRARN
ncbi:MAG: hypothetical protein MZU79_06155 [Anaerotruncus sp.]|nr:hypothetical protein [Anaerotruncus sp.]